MATDSVYSYFRDLSPGVSVLDLSGHSLEKLHVVHCHFLTSYPQLLLWKSPVPQLSASSIFRNYLTWLLLGSVITTNINPKHLQEELGMACPQSPNLYGICEMQEAYAYVLDESTYVWTGLREPGG